jgi:hypothetical protein
MQPPWVCLLLPRRMRCAATVAAIPCDAVQVTIRVA